jgi:hypothetical protein
MFLRLLLTTLESGCRSEALQVLKKPGSTVLVGLHCCGVFGRAAL